MPVLQATSSNYANLFLLLCPQDQVDRADAFPQVLKKVIEWMKSKELGTKYKYCILTDG